MTKAVFLDRDGVVNKAVVRNGKPYPPRDVSEVELVPGAGDSLRRLRNHGYLLVIVTNQPDVRRNKVARETVESIHQFLVRHLPIDDFRVCYHDDRDNCDCRKPLPGLILQAAHRHHITLRQSFLIGDRWRDIEAGAAAGCRTVLIDYRYNERRPHSEPDVNVASLTEAVDWILEQDAFPRSADE